MLGVKRVKKGIVAISVLFIKIFFFLVFNFILILCLAIIRKQRWFNPGLYNELFMDSPHWLYLDPVCLYSLSNTEHGLYHQTEGGVNKKAIY